ncbi:hypothetical protein GF1_11690 [Desulfolithobacter dissulfuricans]|uniref:Uncharacterized protein n=1 Tax=Desulfolithobacter dissulfuricans TaxID=2795293 RepID=A0A915TZT9_9BACT|nr:hypothetical protein [Desulfolithobacter dissulfuricans]BCO08793.1 hypothetical protein GF1_11690 [Desulfolithobacter dissulfuricans]
MAKTKEPASTSVNPRDLADDVLDILEESLDVRKAARILTEAIEKKERLESDMENLMAREEDLEQEIKNLKKNFGAEDSISDMKKLKSLTIERQAVAESIELLGQQLKDTGKLARAIVDQTNHIPVIVNLELAPVAAKWQEDVDRKVDELLQMLTIYQDAARIVCKKQDIVPSDMFGTMALRPIMPKIKEIRRFERFTDMLVI